MDCVWGMKSGYIGVGIRTREDKDIVRSRSVQKGGSYYLRMYRKFWVKEDKQKYVMGLL